MRTKVSVVNNHPQISHYREDKTRVNRAILKPDRRGVECPFDIKRLYISQQPEIGNFFFPLALQNNGNGCMQNLSEFYLCLCLSVFFFSILTSSQPYHKSMQANFHLDRSREHFCSHTRKREAFVVSTHSLLLRFVI